MADDKENLQEAETGDEESGAKQPVVGPDGLTRKDRMKIKRHGMPEQTPEDRVRNFSSVVLGYDDETAYAEAQRCLNCKIPRCIDGCPAEIDIPGFIYAVLENDLEKSYRILKAANALPAVCGRVCPQEAQCELTCVLAKKSPVAIGRLEQYVAEKMLDHYEKEPPEIEHVPITKEKVAVIGAGPAGVTVAMDLKRMGYDVTIFEALHKPGGVLNYGIPPFRLPRRILNAELNTVAEMGIHVRCNIVFGKTLTYDDVMAQDFKAVFLGTGAGLPSFMGIPGENSNGVYSANEYLTRVNLMEAWDFPNADTPVFVGKHVCTVGAGNTAMDSARVSLRMPGVENSYIVYRRTKDEAPARREELHHAEEEGVIFKFLTQPIEVIHDDKNWITALKCIRMELGEPDESGRRRPVPVPDTEFTIPCDTLLMAIGQRPNPIAMRSIPGLEITRWGTVTVDEETMMTEVPGVFAGGDVTVGASTVIMAVGHGKKAARGIDAYLSGLRG
jgi:glutamate synthase (NADPH/NADH) small chain